MMPGRDELAGRVTSLQPSNMVGPDSEVWEQKAAEEILDCAVTVFSEQGYGMGGMRAVAREGGFSLAKAYYYYPKKEALLRAIIERALIDLTKTVLQEIDAYTSPIERLRKMVETTLTYHTRNFNEFKVLYKDSDLLTGEAGERAQALRDQFTREVDECISGYLATLPQCQNSKEEADIEFISERRAGFYLIALMSWTLMNQYRLPKPLPIPVLADQICMLYLNGVNTLIHSKAIEGARDCGQEET